MKNLYFFHADWCLPCKVIEPWVRELATENSWNLISVDVKVDPTTPSEYGVHTLPTVLLTQDGKVLIRTVGVCNKFDLYMKLTGG